MSKKPKEEQVVTIPGRDESIDCEPADIARELRVNVSEVQDYLDVFGRCEPDQVFSPWSLLELAMRVDEGRHAQWKSMRLGYGRPGVEFPEREVEPGSVALETRLTTSFHKGLVTDAWLDTLHGFLKEQPVLEGVRANGLLIPAYNEDRYMGPQSIVKYRFGLGLDISEPDSPLRCIVSFSIEYRPKTNRFKLFNYSTRYEWREAILKNLLLGRGLASEKLLKRAREDVRELLPLKKILGRDSLARLLVESGALAREDLVDLLIENSGIRRVSDDELEPATTLSHREDSVTYEALYLDREPELIVLWDPLSLEEFYFFSVYEGRGTAGLAKREALQRRLTALVGEAR